MAFSISRLRELKFFRIINLIVGAPYAFWGINLQIWNDVCLFFGSDTSERILDSEYFHGSVFASALPLELVAFQALLSRRTQLVKTMWTKQRLKGIKTLWDIDRHQCHKAIIKGLTFMCWFHPWTRTWIRFFDSLTDGDWEVTSFWPFVL